MIPKQDKGRSNAESYRPISLTNCIAKICETVDKNIVMEYCESQNISARLRVLTGNTAAPLTTSLNSLSTSVKLFSCPNSLVLYACMSKKGSMLYGA